VGRWAYNVAYLLVGDLYALILIGTSIHALQYHLVCAATVLQGLERSAQQPPVEVCWGVGTAWCGTCVSNVGCGSQAWA
jgi:hypothetical protein